MRTFSEFLHHVRVADTPGRDTSGASRNLLTRAAAGASTTVPSEGGFLVPSELSKRLLTRIYNTGAILSRAMEIPFTEPAGNILLPQFDETSRANGSRMGGVQVYWSDEAEAATATKPRFGRLELDEEKLVGLCYLTDELQRSINANAIFAEAAFAQEMAFAVEAAMFNGSGIGQPLGVLKSDALIKVPKAPGQAATPVYQNILNMWGRLWAPSHRTAVWVINPELLAQLPGIVRPEGDTPLYDPTRDPDTQPFGTMLGQYVIPFEQCPVAGQLGDIALIDWSRYVLAVRESLETIVSIHVRFLHDESAFRFIWRLNGQPIDGMPITPLNGTLPVSPYVALEAR